jgi:hypothetical protein
LDGYTQRFAFWQKFASDTFCWQLDINTGSMLRISATVDHGSLFGPLDVYLETLTALCRYCQSFVTCYDDLLGPGQE